MQVATGRPLPSAGRHRPPGVRAVPARRDSSTARDCWSRNLVKQLTLFDQVPPARGPCRLQPAGPVRVPSGTRAPRLKREIPRFNEELKRKYFPRRAGRDCFSPEWPTRYEVSLAHREHAAPRGSAVPSSPARDCWSRMLAKQRRVVSPISASARTETVFATGRSGAGAERYRAPGKYTVSTKRVETEEFPRRAV